LKQPDNITFGNPNQPCFLRFTPPTRRKMRKLLLLPILHLMFCTLSPAQNQALIDSLLVLLPQAAEDTAKVKLLCELGYKYVNLDVDESLKHAGQALALAEKLQWPNGIALGQETVGRAHWKKGNFNEGFFRNACNFSLLGRCPAICTYLDSPGNFLNP